MALLNLTSEEFEAAVTKPGITFVDFWAAWCGPCRMFAPIFEAAAKQYPDMQFVKIDTDAEGRKFLEKNNREITAATLLDGIHFTSVTGEQVSIGDTNFKISI